MTTTHNQSVAVETHFGKKVQAINFDRRHTSGGTKTVVKTKGLPKLVVRMLQDGTCISHLPGKRAKPVATAKTEAKAYAKAVEAVWMA